VAVGTRRARAQRRDRALARYLTIWTGRGGGCEADEGCRVMAFTSRTRWGSPG
jgi:hypothetical protein